VIGSIAMLWALTAQAGSFDGMVSLDGFHASSHSTEFGAGKPPRLTANEIGLRIRSRLYEWNDRILVEVDYRGREPLDGDVRNRNLRLLYRAYAQVDAVENRWTVGGGRFLADSVILLPVDGLFTRVDLDRRTSLTAFGGRRAFTTSLRNLPLGGSLPAGGLSFRRYRDRLYIDALGVLSRDQLILPADDTEELTANFGASNASVNVVGVPTEALVLGARVNLAEQATYALGPTWLDLNAVSAYGLWSAVAFADWDLTDHVQLDYTFHRQVVGVLPEEAGDEIIDPNWMDNRFSANIAPGDLGWIRTQFRHRHRATWQEQRYSLQLDANKLGLPGLYARMKGSFDNITDSPFTAEQGLVDHLFWSTSIGVRHKGFDARGGASFYERSAAPASSRRMDITDPATQSGDLQPFVLQAQNIAFLRGFYSGKQWFSGVDIEKNLLDDEFRVLIQLGALTERMW